MNDKELISEARGAFKATNASASLIARLADALEAATEGDYHEGLEEGIKIGRAERDAALAAIERIREAVSGHPECDRYEEGDVISCGWKSAYASVVAALDGAPEPETEDDFEYWVTVPPKNERRK